MQRVYSAHNITRNFVRGEREAMTVDNSAMATARPLVSIGASPSKSARKMASRSLRFPADQASPDGFKTGWVPGLLPRRHGHIRAFDGGAGGGQSRKIFDNSADTVFLEKPLPPLPRPPPASSTWRSHLGIIAPRAALRPGSVP